MTQLVRVGARQLDDILNEAAGRNTQVVMSHRLDGGWMTYKSRILHADAAGGTLILAKPEGESEKAPPELVPGEHIGLTFRRGHKKCMCSAQITRLTMFKLADQDPVAALEIPWPEELQQVQRRVYYRSNVPAGRRIEVRMWDGGLMDRPARDLDHAPHLKGMLVDVSAGGCSLTVDESRDPQLRPGDTVGLSFQPDPRSDPLYLDAIFRHCDRSGRGKLTLGFQFVGLELSPEGRHTLQALTRVVSTFLRIEMRRKQNRNTRPKRRPK